MFLKFLLIAVIFTFSMASGEVFGTVKKIKGDAFMDSVILKVNDDLYIGKNIITKNKSKVIIKQKNGNIITIGENSKLELINFDEVGQKKGKSFFNIVPSINKLSNKFKFKIKLKSATIGIRGTNFIVSSANTENITLREGKLDIIANKDKFKIYNKKTVEENYGVDAQKEKFEEFLNNFNNEFLEFKRKQEYEFEGFKKKFKLEEGTTVVFGKNNSVYKVIMPLTNIKGQFGSFDEFSKLEALTKEFEDNLNNSRSFSPSNTSSDDFKDLDNELEVGSDFNFK